MAHAVAILCTGTPHLAGGAAAGAGAVLSLLNLHPMLFLLFISLTTTNLYSFSVLYHNSTHFCTSRILHINRYLLLPSVLLVFYIAHFEERSDGKDVGKRFHRFFFFKVG